MSLFHPHSLCLCYEGIVYVSLSSSFLLSLIWRYCFCLSITLIPLVSDMKVLFLSLFHPHSPCLCCEGIVYVSLSPSFPLSLIWRYCFCLSITLIPLVSDMKVLFLSLYHPHSPYSDMKVLFMSLYHPNSLSPPLPLFLFKIQTLKSKFDLKIWIIKLILVKSFCLLLITSINQDKGK